jgi:hypothetical protein
MEPRLKLTNPDTSTPTPGHQPGQNPTAKPLFGDWIASRAFGKNKTPARPRIVIAKRVKTPRAASPSPARGLPQAVVPITEATDPRWMLATRTASELDGEILRPERRDELVHFGKSLGLTPFDANLIIAIVQDQARRGCPPDHCPAAAESQLAIVTLPQPKPFNRRMLHIAWFVTALLAFEVFFFKWCLLH